MTLSEVLRTRRWLLFLLGLAFFYFYSGGGPNQGSRFNLDRAILEHQELKIDEYHKNSEDKALYRGHYYCDKAPGTSFVALPALYLTRVVMKFSGVSPDSAQAVAIGYRVATWTAATLPALLTCWILFGWVLRKGYPPIAAVYVCLAVGLASPLWVYATLYWGNALAAFFLVLAARSVDRLIHLGPLHPAAGLALLAGFACGGAVLVEYPTAPMAVTLAALVVIKLRPWQAYFRRLLWFGLGAMIAAALLATYNTAAFGTPFHLGYADVQGFDGMKQGIFGVTTPSLKAIAGVIWGPRGFLMTAPLLVLGLLGHAISIARRHHKTMAVVCVIFSIYPILLNVSYAYWDGGWTYGPRHMSSALPFLALGLAPLYRALPKLLRGLALAALAAGAFVTLVGISVHGMTPYSPKDPLSELYWPSFWLGRFARHNGWIEAGGPATNLGLALGLDRPQSLIPFWVGIAVAIFGLIRSLMKRPCPVNRGIVGRAVL